MGSEKVVHNNEDEHAGPSRLLQPGQEFLQRGFVEHGPAKLVGFVELAARIGAGDDVVGLFGNAGGNLCS